ncbi:MAG TPA: hypothetical protein VHN99_10545, partial [Deinococcales bacterium]|nr:hypothetical protein [Deinococcales bacterium]
ATATSVAFPALNLPSGEWVLYVVPVRAISAGTEQTDAVETYQNHDGQLDPQTSTDPTNVQ